MNLRSSALLSCVVLAAIGVGCGTQPLLTDAFGLLPGPSTSLLREVDMRSSATSALASGDVFSLLSGVTGTDGTGVTTGGLDLSDLGGTDTGTTDDTSSGDEQECPEGQVWVGTFNGVAINACVDEDTVAQWSSGGL